MKKPKKTVSTKIHNLPLREFMKFWREAEPRNWQAKQAAAEFNVRADLWSRWETGRLFPKPERVKKLAAFMGVPICCFYWDGEHRCPGCVRRRK